MMKKMHHTTADDKQASILYHHDFISDDNSDSSLSNSEDIHSHAYDDYTPESQMYDSYYDQEDHHQ